MMSNRIKIPINSYIYLFKEDRRQKGCNEVNDKTINMLKREADKNGYYIIYDFSFKWNIEKIKNMLKDNNLEYQELNNIEYELI